MNSLAPLGVALLLVLAGCGSAAPTETPTTTATESPTSAPTPTATETPTATATPTATSTRTPTPTASPTPTPTPTATPTATPTPTPTATATPTPTATATPTPTATATPTPKPELEEHKVAVGTRNESLGENASVRYWIKNFHDVAVTLNFDVVWYEDRDIMADVTRVPLTLEPGEEVYVDVEYAGNKSIEEIDYAKHNLDYAND